MLLLAATALVVGASDPAGPWISGSVAGTAIAAVFVLANRFLRRNDDQYRVLVKPAYERVAALEGDNAALERRLELAIRLLRRHGIDVPPEVLP